MTDENILNIIDDLNSGANSKNYILRQIGIDIFYAKVWQNLFNENSSEVSSEKFYFIKYKGLFVGAIQYAGSDLHWYIKLDSRKKGLLTWALRDYILPHIFLIQKKDKQRITISKTRLSEKGYNDSEKVALELGFEKVENENSKKDICEYYISKEQIKTVFVNSDNFNKIQSENYLSEIGVISNQIINRIKYLKDRSELYFNEFPDEFPKLEDLMFEYRLSLEDIWQDRHTEDINGN